MKLLNLFLIFMVNAAQWQPLGESPSHMSHNHDENNVGKAYFGRAFAIEDEQKKKAMLSRPEQTAELIQKLAYAKMILNRLRQYTAYNGKIRHLGSVVRAPLTLSPRCNRRLSRYRF